jgi:hypothetical protein
VVHAGISERASPCTLFSYCSFYPAVVFVVVCKRTTHDSACNTPQLNASAASATDGTLLCDDQSSNKPLDAAQLVDLDTRHALDSTGQLNCCLQSAVADLTLVSIAPDSVTVHCAAVPHSQSVDYTAQQHYFGVRRESELAERRARQQVRLALAGSNGSLPAESISYCLIAPTATQTLLPDVIAARSLQAVRSLSASTLLLRWTNSQLLFGCASAYAQHRQVLVYAVINSCIYIHRCAGT